MNMGSSDIERFLRQEVDSSIRVQHTIGLDLGSKGVAFQCQSSEQSVWVVLEYDSRILIWLLLMRRCKLWKQFGERDVSR